MRALALCLLVACGGDATQADVADTGAGEDAGGDADVGGDAGEDADVGADADADTGEVADADTGEVVDARPWYEGGVVYELFVRSFQDSDGDGIGDLRGLVDRLDYLNDGVPGEGDDLEVDAIWLMPIFSSDSYHGYDTVDYRAVDPDYGSDADFDALVAAADARGVRVILDLVMNHTGSAHPWFLASRSGADDPKRSWYVWRGDDPGWKQPFGSDNVWHRYGGNSYYYGVFWSGMPDLNYREPAVINEMIDVARHWVERGAAGFRLDAARYLVESADGDLYEQPETHAFWKRLRADVPGAYLVGEVWTNRTAVTTYWGDGAELHQAFDFDLQGAMLNSMKQNRASWISAELGRQKAAGTPWSYAATFLSNHDLDRLSLGIDDGEQRAAAFILMTLPGTPYLYYGDELGAKSAPKLGDEAKRGPMAWTATAPHGFTTGTPWVGFAAESDVRNVASALADPGSLARYYQTLSRLRHAHPALARGELVMLTVAEPALLAFVRATPDEALLAVVNLGAGQIDVGAIDARSAQGSVGGGPWTIEALLGSGPQGSAEPSAVPTGASFSAFEGRIWRITAAGE